MPKFATMVSMMTLEEGDRSLRAYLEALAAEYAKQAGHWRKQAEIAKTKRSAARDTGEAEGWLGAAQMVYAVMRGLPSQTEEEYLRKVIEQAYIHIGSMLPERMDPHTRGLHDKAWAELRKGMPQ